MIIQIAPDAPLIVKAAAATLLWTHIGGAATGIVSGTVSILARKGSRVHVRAGQGFVIGMTAMGVAGAIGAPLVGDRASSVMGVFVTYLALTAWMTLRRPGLTLGRFEWGAAAVAIGVTVANFWLARLGSASPKGLIDAAGQPFQLAVAAGVITGLAAAMDLKVLASGGLMGAARLRRHIWRMSLALFITWGSFAGQPRAQPEMIRGAPWLFLPALGCLVLLVFWMVRTRGPRRRRPERAAAPAAA